MSATFTVADYALRLDRAAKQAADAGLTGVLVTPGPDLCRLLGLAQPQTTYGRTAFIYCDGYPAVELLEIVAPQPPS